MIHRVLGVLCWMFENNFNKILMKTIKILKIIITTTMRAAESELYFLILR